MASDGTAIAVTATMEGPATFELCYDDVLVTLRTRQAVGDDYAVFIRLWPELGIDDPLPTPEHFAKQIAPGALIAELDGQAVGYSFGRTLTQVAHLATIMVDADYRKRGVGRVLR